MTRVLVYRPCIGSARGAGMRASRRSGLGIERMIDDNWDGTMIHDGFFSYNTQFPEAVHQR